jgi:hypothetical protein
MSTVNMATLTSFKEKMKELYKLEDTATSEFDRMFFQMMNQNFRRHEAKIEELVKNGSIRIKEVSETCNETKEMSRMEDNKTVTPNKYCTVCGKEIEDWNKHKKSRLHREKKKIY